MQILFRRRLKITILTIVVFTIAIAYFSPIMYMFLTGLKTEAQAVTPTLIFRPTMETMIKVLGDRNMLRFLSNSVIQVLTVTLASLVLGTLAAFVLVFGNFRKKGTGDRFYLWFITTILLPPVAVIIPLYTWFQKMGLIGSPLGLMIVYTGFHVPIVVWMLYSFFKDVPKEIMESSSLDGCSRMQQLVYLAIPLVRSGIMAAGLLVAVFIWNEFFLGFNLTNNSTATLPVYMARFREQQGMFVAQLSAASTIAVLPAIILGWITQKSLVKGLTMGAVKG